MRRLTPDRLENMDAATSLGGVSLSSRPSAPVLPDPAEQARVQQQRLFDEARAQGQAEGLRDAEREIEKRVAAIETRMRADHDAAVKKLRAEEERLRAFVAGLGQSLSGYASESETMAIEVAYAAVVRLLGEKSADRSLMVDLCRAVIKDYGHPPATLRVSDADLSLLDDAGLDIAVEADRRLAPGQCVVETARGQFESGLDVRLEALRKAFMATLAEHRGLA